MKGFTTSRAIAVLLLLVLIVGAGNLWATYDQNRSSQAAQRRAGEIVERKLCATFARLAARKPPPGNPLTNPSRAYLQGQWATLNEVPGDLGCPH